MQESVVCAKNISKRHGNFHALRDASFCVARGEIVGLIGPNGAGKTTLFECVAGLLAPTSGTVFVEGRVAGARHRKHGLYLVPEAIHPYAQQTVQWTLRFFSELNERSPADRPGITAALSLDTLVHRRLGHLSKGEHRRVMLAIGLLSTQPLLMLDEPFDGLDLRQTRDVMTLLRQEAQHGRALLLSIHQLSDAARVCDRLLLLSAGRIVGSGTLAELQAAAHVPTENLEDIFLALT